MLCPHLEPLQLDNGGQVRAQHLGGAPQRQHQALVPLLLLGVAAVVHEHLDAVAGCGREGMWLW